METFEIKNNFYLNQEPFQIISGAIHYFRVVPEYWLDRLEKLKAFGANTVETYVPWNMHEPKKGEYNFEGMLDIVKFIKLAQDLGLYVIIRPSPYICAEWEFGGLPGWLLEDRNMRLRVNYSPFIQHVEAYYKILLPMLIPFQITCGGPIILMQVENEYGYYGTDQSYLYKIKELMVNGGVTVPLVTSDGPQTENLEAGSVNDVLPTGNFGSQTTEKFHVLREFVKDRPLMCTEFWVGWFDHWGNGGHMRGKLEESILDLDKMLTQGHVNIYMFQGGTNFGFMNGSNYYDVLTPDVTSYDYDGVLTENGEITEKYLKYKEIIKKYKSIPEIKFSTEINKMEYGEVMIENRVSLFSVLDDISVKNKSIFTQSMESFGQYYGYILYQSKLKTIDHIERIRLWEANDRANFFIDKEPIFTAYDRELLDEKNIKIENVKDKNIKILMENMGRVNFGPLMEKQRKGIDHCVQINGHLQHDWEIYCLPLDNLEKLNFQKEYIEGIPGFYRFYLDITEIGDSFLDFTGWGKGCAFVNGFNIGRFWEIGPQKRLYVPGPLFKKGRNEVIIFETEGKTKEFITFCKEHDIG